MKRNVVLRLLALLTVLMTLLLSLAGSYADGNLIAKKKKKKTVTPTPYVQTTATPTATVAAVPTPTPVPADPALAAAQQIVDYLAEYGRLPDNFLTKKEAQALGWDSSRNYVSDVAPGMSLGGSYFGNYEKQLPDANGRRWSECDCYYNGGKRNAYRLLYSNDGLYFYSADHYTTYTQLYPSDLNTSAP